MQSFLDVTLPPLLLLLFLAALLSLAAWLAAARARVWRAQARLITEQRNTRRGTAAALITAHDAMGETIGALTDQPGFPQDVYGRLLAAYEQSTTITEGPQR